MTTTQNLKAADLLEAAALALAIPTVWGKGAFARRSDGVEVDIENPKACTFCSAGAVQAANLELKYGYEVKSLASEALDKAVRHSRFGQSFIVDFNDARNNKGPVLEVFGSAIDSLRGL